MGIFSFFFLIVQMVPNREKHLIFEYWLLVYIFLTIIQRERSRGIIHAKLSDTPLTL